ncbi:mechanosensitive ion channel [Pseudooceanicola nanhaiensis]|nr:mechanosensitive ion channel [Pseudooceanicola nanhaiensis]
MRFPRLRWVPLLALLLCVAPPLAAQDSGQPSGTITVTDSADQDAAIAVRIRDILHELEGYEDVTVAVNSGIVTLRGSVLTSEDLSRLNVLAARVEGVVAIRNEVVETTDVMRRLDPAVQRMSARFWQLVAYLPLLAVAALAFLLVLGAGFVLARMKQPWDRIAPNAFIADIYRQIVRLAFTVAGVVVALDILGATALLSTILGAAGIIGLAISFAVKDTVENFIASIMLSMRQPFRPNDAVEINGDEGKVIRLTSRATILLSYDGNQIRIPNATVFKSRIVNFSTNMERRFSFDLGVAPETDLAQARQLGEETLLALPFTLWAPAPAAYVHEAGDSTITLRFQGWIDQTQTGLLAAKGEAIRQVMLAYAGAGIAMPEPGFRLLSGTPAEAAPPAERPGLPQPPSPITEGVASTGVSDLEGQSEHDLELIVEGERRESRGKDLLNPAAPTE